MLERIFKKHNIDLKNKDGSIRNAIDIIEDMYLKLNSVEFNYIMFEIMEEERYGNIFDEARGRSYKGAE